MLVVRIRVLLVRFQLYNELIINAFGRIPHTTLYNGVLRMLMRS
jgi:hypothetical protein